MIDVDGAARRVGDALRRLMLDGVVEGLEEFDVGPAELPLLMAFVSAEPGFDIEAARRWRLVQWVIEVHGWILDRATFKAIHVGSRPIKAVPNWLKPHEQAAWRYARERAGLRITAIEDNVRARLRVILADAIALRPLGGRQAVADLVKRRLAEEFQHVKKNWQRIARTETNAAFSQGVLVTVVAEDRNGKVVVLTSTDACQKCKDAYLDDEGVPKVWNVRDLLTSGLVPPLHPNCRCQPKPVNARRKSAT